MVKTNVKLFRNVKNVLKLSEQDLKSGSSVSSWHNQYKDSAWLFVGGLPYDLTEGDILCIFSQYGEIVNINLIRDKATGKQKGFCFLCYEDQRSTILAVDNFNGIKLLGRTIRVDHVANYKPPKDLKNANEDLMKLQNEGCGPLPKPPEVITEQDSAEISTLNIQKRKKKGNKLKKKKKKAKKVNRSHSESAETSEQSD